MKYQYAIAHQVFPRAFLDTDLQKILSGDGGIDSLFQDRILESFEEGNFDTEIYDAVDWTAQEVLLYRYSDRSLFKEELEWYEEYYPGDHAWTNPARFHAAISCNNFAVFDAAMGYQSRRNRVIASLSETGHHTLLPRYRRFQEKRSCFHIAGNHLVFCGCSYLLPKRR